MILSIQWEPGFNGGFDQHFQTRIKDLTTGYETIQTFAPRSLDPNARWVYQNITIDPDSKYSFAVKASNVQGESRYAAPLPASNSSSRTCREEESLIALLILLLLSRTNDMMKYWFSWSRVTVKV